MSNSFNKADGSPQIKLTEIPILMFKRSHIKILNLTESEGSSCPLNTFCSWTQRDLLYWNSLTVVSLLLFERTFTQEHHFGLCSHLSHQWTFAYLPVSLVTSGSKSAPSLLLPWFTDTYLVISVYSICSLAISFIFSLIQIFAHSTLLCKLCYVN